MTRIISWARQNRAKTVILFVVTTAVALAAGLGVALATDQPSFCGSSCHEMGPYHEAWAQGPHKDVACIDCHVEGGFRPRMEHKVVALKEVWDHFTGEPRFPQAEASPVPDERCLRCHESVAVTSTGFDHGKHAAEGSCQSCHSDVGHRVSEQALKDEGVFNPQAQKRVLAARVAVVDGGIASIPGHVSEPCSRCHDMAKTGCSSCHEPKHDGTGPAEKTAECNACHAPGAEFAFAHPQGEFDCGSCHKPPAEHTFRGSCETCHGDNGDEWKFSHTAKSDCTNCHKVPDNHRKGPCAQCHATGVDWKFRHPSSRDCTSCHSKPTGHRAGACTQCHSAGGSWAFRHPSAKSGCTSCHARPSGHRSGSCTNCHTAGGSWKFRHPGKSANCQSCHSKPGGHRSGSCTSCHTTSSWKFRHPGSGANCGNCHGRPSGHRSGSCASCHSTSSWRFRHPNSSSCSSCHKAPGGHYGSNCSSCHSPSRAWSSASFSHPKIPGGKHSYRSFSCGTCHPSGYGSYSCKKCHSSNNPKDDDDDD